MLDRACFMSFLFTTVLYFMIERFSPAPSRQITQLYYEYMGPTTNAIAVAESVRFQQFGLSKTTTCILR